jgi:hypothetical protein
VQQDVIAAWGAGKTAFEFSAKLKMEIETKVYSSLSVSMEQTISDYAGDGEDLVIFYTVPHHQYTYYLASHPDGNSEGSKVVVNIPMKPRIFSVSREFYNANNGSQTDIDDKILGHVAGEPLTYPSLSDVGGILEEHMPLGITMPPVTVNQGSGHKEIELALSTEATVGAEITLSTEFETETCVAGFCIGVNVGTSVSAFAEATFSAATTFSGSVGAIDADHWADNMYDFGLFAYLDNMRSPNGQVTLPFTVVNYYVN